MKAADHIITAATQKAIASSAVLRFGEVTAVGTGTITVTLDGISVANVPVISSYATPTIGDHAWLLMQGTTLVAIGCT